MTTRSSAARPLWTTRSPLIRARRVSTTFGTTVPSAATVITICRDWSGTTAAAGTSRAGAGWPRATRRRANCPGVMARSGFGTVARAWIVPLLRFTALSMKSSVPCRSKLPSPSRLIATLGMRRGAVIGLLIGKVVGFAHVEIEVDRVERDDRRQQRRRARAASAAAHQAADRDEMRADPPGERRGDAGELEVELGVPDRRLGGVDGGLRAALVGGALIDALRGAEVGPLELLRPPELRLAQRFLASAVCNCATA